MPFIGHFSGGKKGGRILKSAEWEITCRQLEVLKMMGRADVQTVMKEGQTYEDWIKGETLEGKSAEYLAGYYAGLQAAMDMIRKANESEGKDERTD